MKDETKLRKLGQRASTALNKYLQECRAMTELVKPYLSWDAGAGCEYDDKLHDFVVVATVSGREQRCPIDVFAQMMRIEAGNSIKASDFTDACKWQKNLRKQGLRLPKTYNMKYLEFDDYGRAYVSEEEFMAYLQQNAQDGDYTKERDGVVYYFNGGGCKLAEYHRNEGYGETF